MNHSDFTHMHVVFFFKAMGHFMLIIQFHIQPGRKCIGQVWRKQLRSLLGANGQKLLPDPR